MSNSPKSLWKKRSLLSVRTRAEVGTQDKDTLTRASIALEKRPHVRTEPDVSCLLQMARRCDALQRLPLFVLHELCLHMRGVEAREGDLLLVQGEEIVPEDRPYALLLLEGAVSLHQSPEALETLTSAPSGADPDGAASIGQASAEAGTVEVERMQDGDPRRRSATSPAPSVQHSPSHPARATLVSDRSPASSPVPSPTLAKRRSALDRRGSDLGAADLPLSFTQGASASSVMHRKRSDLLRQHRESAASPASLPSPGSSPSPGPSATSLIVKNHAPIAHLAASASGISLASAAGPSLGPVIRRIRPLQLFGDEGIEMHRSMVAAATTRAFHGRDRRQVAARRRLATAVVTSSHAFFAAIPRAELAAAAIAASGESGGALIKSSHGHAVAEALPPASQLRRILNSAPDRRSREDSDLIFDALRTYAPIRRLPLVIQRGLAQACTLESVSSNRVLRIEGDVIDVDSEAFLVVVSGEIAVHVRGVNTTVTPSGKHAVGSDEEYSSDSSDDGTVVHVVSGYQDPMDVGGPARKDADQSALGRAKAAEKSERRASRAKARVRANARRRAVPTNPYSPFEQQFGPCLLRLGRGMYAGGDCLDLDDPRVFPATLRTATAVEVLCVFRSDARRLFTAYRAPLYNVRPFSKGGTIATLLGTAPGARAADDVARVVAYLPATSLWSVIAPIPREARDRLLAVSEWRTFTPSAVLAKPGDPVTGIWIVVDGSIAEHVHAHLDSSENAREDGPRDSEEGIDVPPSPTDAATRALPDAAVQKKAKGEAKGLRMIRQAARKAAVARALNRTASFGGRSRRPSDASTPPMTDRKHSTSSLVAEQDNSHIVRRSTSRVGSMLPERSRLKIGDRTRVYAPGDIPGCELVLRHGEVHARYLVAGENGARALFIPTLSLDDALGEAVEQLEWAPATATRIVGEPTSGRSQRDAREVAPWVARVKFFSQFPMRTVRAIAASVHLVRVSAGTPIVREGEEGDKFYVIADGIASVHVARKHAREHPTITLMNDARTRAEGRQQPMQLSRAVSAGLAVAGADQNAQFQGTLGSIADIEGRESSDEEGQANQEKGGSWKRVRRRHAVRKAADGFVSARKSQGVEFSKFAVPTGTAIQRLAEIEHQWGGQVAVLTKGDSFGARGLEVEGAKRSATVVARTELSLLVLHRHAYLSTIGKHRGVVFLPGFSLQLLEKSPASRTPADVGVLMGLASHIAFLSQLSVSAREAACSRLRYRLVPQGHTVVREGEDADALHIVLSGAIALHAHGVVPGMHERNSRLVAATHEPGLELADPTDIGRRIAVLQHGDAFGEEALGVHDDLLRSMKKLEVREVEDEDEGEKTCTTRKCTATGVALLDTGLLVLSPRDWEHVLVEYPSGIGSIEWRPTLLDEQLRRNAVVERWTRVVSKLVPELAADDRWMQLVSATHSELTRNLMLTLPLFASMEPMCLKKLSRVARYQSLPRGTRLYKRGNMTDFVYIIVSGSVGMYRGDPRAGGCLVATMGPQQSFGEFEVVQDTRRRQLTAITSSDTRLICITDAHFLAMWPPKRLAALRHRVDVFSRRITTFGPNLTEEQQQLLYYIMVPRPVPKGKVVIAEGAKNSNLYLVFRGSFRCLRGVPRQTVGVGDGPAMQAKSDTQDGRGSENDGHALVRRINQIQEELNDAKKSQARRRMGFLNSMATDTPRGNAAVAAPRPATAPRRQRTPPRLRVAQHPVRELVESPLRASRRTKPNGGHGGPRPQRVGAFATDGRSRGRRGAGSLRAEEPSLPTTTLPTPDAVLVKSNRRSHPSSAKVDALAESGKDRLPDEWAGQAASQVEVSVLGPYASFGELDQAPDTVVCDTAHSLLLCASKDLLRRALHSSMIAYAQRAARERAAWRTRRAWYLARVSQGASQSKDEHDIRDSALKLLGVSKAQWKAVQPEEKFTRSIEEKPRTYRVPRVAAPSIRDTLELAMAGAVARSSEQLELSLMQQAKSGEMPGFTEEDSVRDSSVVTHPSQPGHGGSANEGQISKSEHKQQTFTSLATKLTKSLLVHSTQRPSARALVRSQGGSRDKQRQGGSELQEDGRSPVLLSPTNVTEARLSSPQPATPSEVSTMPVPVPSPYHRRKGPRAALQGPHERASVADGQLFGSEADDPGHGLPHKGGLRLLDTSARGWGGHVSRSLASDEDASEGTAAVNEGNEPATADGYMVEHGVLVRTSGSATDVIDDGALAREPRHATMIAMGVTGVKTAAEAAVAISVRMDAPETGMRTESEQLAVQRRREERTEQQQRADSARASSDVVRGSSVPLEVQRSLLAATRAAPPHGRVPGVGRAAHGRPRTLARHDAPLRRAGRPESDFRTGGGQSVAPSHRSTTRLFDHTAGPSGGGGIPKFVRELLEAISSSSSAADVDDDPTGQQGFGPLPHPGKRADMAAAVKQMMACLSESEVARLMRVPSVERHVAAAAAAVLEGASRREASGRAATLKSSVSTLRRLAHAKPGGRQQPITHIDPSVDMKTLRRARLTVRRDEGLADDGKGPEVAPDKVPRRRPATSYAHAKGSASQAPDQRVSRPQSARKVVRSASAAAARGPIGLHRVGEETQNHALVLGLASPLPDPETRTGGGLVQALVQARRAEIAPREVNRDEGSDMAREAANGVRPHPQRPAWLLIEGSVPLAGHVTAGVNNLPSLPDAEEVLLGRGHGRVMRQRRRVEDRERRERAGAVQAKAERLGKLRETRRAVAAAADALVHNHVSQAEVEAEEAKRIAAMRKWKKTGRRVAAALNLKAGKGGLSVWKGARRPRGLRAAVPVEVDVRNSLPGAQVGPRVAYTASGRPSVPQKKETEEGTGPSTRPVRRTPREQRPLSALPHSSRGAQPLQLSGSGLLRE